MRELIQARVAVRPFELREGQAAFNALYELRPDLANQIRSTELDPFYRSDRLEAFYEWLDSVTDGS